MTNSIIGYSERGIMNALIFELDRKNLMQEFLTHFFPKIKTPQGEIKIYLEHSLSQYGNPDLAIIYDKCVIFFEAKVAAFNKKWSVEREQKKFNAQSPYKGYSSNLFFQLELKKQLFENNLIDKYDKIHKIGNHPIVKRLYDEIKKCHSAHYVAIIPPNNSSEKRKTINDIKIIYWDEIKEFCIEYNMQNSLSTFEYNKGQIYTEGLVTSENENV